MRKFQTKALVEGAIFAAITVMIGILKFYIPIIALISIIWSVPTILISFRHGFKVSINSVIVSSILVAILTEPIEGLGFFIGFGLPGIIMGYLLQKKLRPGKTIFFTGIVLTICSFASIVLGMLVIGVDIVKSYNDLFIEMKNLYREATNSMGSITGINREDILKMSADFEKMLDSLQLVLPGGFLFSGIMLSYINFKMTRLILQRVNYTIEDAKPFSLWRLSSKWMISIMVIVLIAVVEISYIKLPQLHAFMMNVFWLIQALFAVLGISVAKFFLDRHIVSKPVKVMVMFFMVFVFGNIITYIGITDMIFDFRKLQNKPAGDA